MLNVYILRCSTVQQKAREVAKVENLGAVGTRGLNGKIRTTVARANSQSDLRI